MRGCGFILSNFGTFDGRHENLAFVPPSVALLGAGPLREQVVASQDTPAVHRVLSLSFDPRGNQWKGDLLCRERPRYAPRHSKRRR
jgi:pyruvate dehydrogenase E2 component (dihydrolipoamide acetyltransferase)